MARQEWLLKRNCSLTPCQTLGAFAVLCVLPFGVALAVMLVHGTWIVLDFAIVEMSLVGLAFLHYARHASDREHIVLDDDGLLIEQFNADRVRKIHLDAHWLRVTSPRNGRDMISLEARGMRVEVGRFVPDQTRRRIAEELRHGLRGRSWAC
jgi:uncharacterized membrane protein